MRLLITLLTLVLATFSLNVAAAPDENVVTAKDLVARAEALEGKDPKAIVALIKQALPGLNDPKDAALNRKALGMLCINTAVFDAKSALPIAEQGLKLALSAGDAKHEAIFLRCHGYANEQLGNMGAAAASYEQGVVAAERSGDKEALSDALATRGESRSYRGRYDEAIADLKKSYDLSVELKLKNSQRYLLSSIANLYADTNVGQYDKAIEYYRKLLAENESGGNKAGTATAHFNIGSTLEHKEEYEAALREYRLAYNIDRTLDDPSSVADEERVIGALLTKQNKAVEALPWIEKALATFRKQNDADGVARVQLTRGITFRKLGRLSDSMNDLDASRKYFEAEKNDRYLVKIHEERASTYAAAGDWHNAYEAGNTFRSIRQKLDKGLLEEQTSRLRVQFDTEKKERENLALQIENRHRGEALAAANKVRALQWQVIVLGVALMVLLALLGLRQFYRTRRLRILAMTDELTTLPNRRHILTFLGDQAKIAYESEQPISLVAFDIDHFKNVNDVHGHDGGDTALKALAGIANQALRRGDRVGRIGGEEFLVVLPGTDRAGAMEIADRLRRSIEVSELEKFVPGLRMTISLGVVEWNAGHESIDALIKRADKALYEAKNTGRNRVVAN